MIANLTRSVPLILLTAGFIYLPHGRAAAQTDQDAINVLRSVVKADRQEVVAETLQLTDTESQAFWPLYHQYRAEMDKVADELLKVVQEYAGSYPDVPEDRAKKMLKELGDLQTKHVATRTKYLKRFGKVLPAAKNLRFAQVENRLDLALQLRLVANVPLVPIEGRMTAEASSAAAYVTGVPGGIIVQTFELIATVASMDKANRKVTLVSNDGIKKTVKAGPEVINFDQIRVGDQLKVTATEELVVQMAEQGESADDGADAVVILAPKGAKPGGLAAETMQVTATVTAINQQQRTATLRFEDGSTRTIPVRRDVNLSARKVGEKVVFRVTEMLAIRIEKP
jgi:hypothetical protein